jgi:hypothetical protein
MEALRGFDREGNSKKDTDSRTGQYQGVRKRGGVGGQREEKSGVTDGDYQCPVPLCTADRNTDK